MSLLDLASLVLAPTATKEGKVYSAIPDTGEGDMTFTRGSAATRVNSAGLIEKERGNLLLQSNTFDTTWGAGGGTLTSGQTGYDGSSDAWLFTMSSGANICNQTNTQSGVQTYSVYAKGSVNNGIRLYAFGSTNVNVYFNLNTGAVAAETNNIDASIEDVGSGWYRCSMTYNSTNTNLYLYLTNNSNSNAGSGSILIQDAQLEQGLVATDYIETTTSAVYEGITDDVPRVDYSGGGCPSLLLESQRTNLVTDSEYFGAWTNDTNTSLTANAIQSPSGLIDAYKISAGTSTARQAIKFDLTLSGDVVQSVFAKKGEYSVVQITDGRNGSLYANFDLENGVLGSYEDCTPSIQEFSDGWYRCVIVYHSTLSIVNTRISIAESTTQARLVNFAGNGSDGIYIWGAMLEAGSYSTSYIPTYSVSSTRVADSCSKTGISELIGQTEGTIYWEGVINGLDNSFGNIITSERNVTTSFSVLARKSGMQFQCEVFDGSAKGQCTGGSLVFGTKHKLAYAYKSGDFALYVDGVQAATSTQTWSPAGTIDDIYIADPITFFGYKEGNKHTQAILFPTRLTNDQLEELTK